MVFVGTQQPHLTSPDHPIWKPAAFAPCYPATTFSSISRLIWLLERAEFCPALLDLHRNECTHTGKHASSSNHLMFVHVGLAVEQIVQPPRWAWVGAIMQPLALVLMVGSLLGATKVVLRTRQPVCLQGWGADPFWSTDRAMVPQGRRDGVMACRQQTGNTVPQSKGSLFPHWEKAERQQLFWWRSLCGPGEYRTRCMCRHALASKRRPSEVEKGSAPGGQSLLPQRLLNSRCWVFLALKSLPVSFSVKMMPAGDVWCFLLHFLFC